MEGWGLATVFDMCPRGENCTIKIQYYGREVIITKIKN